MSTEKEINKALSDIYSDLEKLQSAREQVEIVTQSSNELTKSTSTLLQNLKELANQFGEENSSNISQLTKTLVEFENKINDISAKGNDSISNYIESFRKQIVGVIEQFSKQLTDNEKNLNAISNLNNEKIRKKIEEFEKTTNDLKTNAENGIEEIQTLAISKIENQEKIIAKTIESIQNTNSQADKMIEVITNYNIPNSLEKINEKLDYQEKVNKINKTLLIVLLSIIGIGGAVAIGILITML
jgi:uncharacterized phage infection (PIP) family protein YhgE